MFGRQPKDNNPPENPEIPEIMFPSESEIEDSAQEDTELSQIKVNLQSKSEENNPEVVNIVEKISGIVSPYFIVVVGLVLYEDNFLLGLLLIIVGILSLLKISWGDITGFFREIKEAFRSDDCYLSENTDRQYSVETPVPPESHHHFVKSLSLK